MKLSKGSQRSYEKTNDEKKKNRRGKRHTKQ